MESKAQTNVLLVFANPINTGRLRLDTEAREIQQSIERSKYRDNINLVTRQATTIKDFRRVLLEETFQIIHISGHGSRNGLLLAAAKKKYRNAINSVSRVRREIH